MNDGIDLKIKKPMTYEELQNQIPEVRIIATGEEFKVDNIDYSSKKVWLKSGETYSFSEVRFLTPLSFKGKRIAIGDEVKVYDDWYKVYGYSWFNGRYFLLLVGDNNFEAGCMRIYIGEIQDHRTTPKDSDQVHIDALIKSGRLKDGKILN